MDLDSDLEPAIFVSNIQDGNKQKSFSVSYFLKVHLHHFSKRTVIKKSQNSRNQGLSSYFCLMIKGSGAGCVPRTNGSGSGSAPLAAGFLNCYDFKTHNFLRYHN
jgi:hypothetical protein